jgi:hypothetical protein
LFVLQSRDMIPAFTKQLNLKPKQLSLMYNLDINPCDSATQRAE